MYGGEQHKSTDVNNHGANLLCKRDVDDSFTDKISYNNIDIRTWTNNRIIINPWNANNPEYSTLNGCYVEYNYSDIPYIQRLQSHKQTAIGTKATSQRTQMVYFLMQNIIKAQIC